MDADDMIGDGGGIGGAAESSAVESSDSAREGFPFAVAPPAAGTAGSPTACTGERAARHREPGTAEPGTVEPGTVEPGTGSPAKSGIG